MSIVNCKELLPPKIHLKEVVTKYVHLRKFNKTLCLITQSTYRYKGI